MEKIMELIADYFDKDNTYPYPFLGNRYELIKYIRCAIRDYSNRYFHF